jgi:hypothetical protein
LIGDELANAHRSPSPHNTRRILVERPAAGEGSLAAKGRRARPALPTRHRTKQLLAKTRIVVSWYHDTNFIAAPARAHAFPAMPSAHAAMRAYT